jgi:DNA-binding NtrC family response regulator
MAPLRNRTDDIPLLANTFILRMQATTGKKISGLTSAAMECFMEYRWPGNVRELKSALEFAFVIAEEGLIDLDQLPPNIASAQHPHNGPHHLHHIPAEDINSGYSHASASGTFEHPEKTALIEALRRTNGNQTQAARILGINRVTVWNRMKKYGIYLKRVLSV